MLDLTNWVTLGMERQRMPVLVGGSSVLGLSHDGGNVAVFPTTGTLKRGGFTFPDNSERCCVAARSSCRSAWGAATW